MNNLTLSQNINHIDQYSSVTALESGKILFFPDYSFHVEAPNLLSEMILDRRHKNISYDYKKNKLGAFKQTSTALESDLTHMMHDYAEFALHLIQRALPSYTPYLQWGRTSFRPAQIKGRVSSKRKDDTRLHVDSFAASPVNGRRILRVFCNINPYQEPRVWQVGEPFSKVLSHFAPRIKPYRLYQAKILQWIKATKSLRTAYDHYMLHLHDTMKLDEQYQSTVHKTRIDFPSYSTWIVFTDHVSHAALSGQHLLEQTFYLPVAKMANPELSPLYEWQKIKPQIHASV